MFLAGGSHSSLFICKNELIFCSFQGLLILTNRKDKKISGPIVHNRFKYASVVLKIDGYDSLGLNCGCTIV
jgi:hypothetical protein